LRFSKINFIIKQPFKEDALKSQDKINLHLYFSLALSKKQYFDGRFIQNVYRSKHMNKKLLPPNSPFDSIKHVDENGEYWLARELMPLLDYVEWRNFEKVIDKAKEASLNSGNPVKIGFMATPTKTSDLGGRPSIDYRLTRYACYLIAQNGDPRKQEIALAQTYFAVQTRKQEIYEQSQEWLAARKSTRDGYKLMQYALKMNRDRQGKITSDVHYMSQAQMICRKSFGKEPKKLREEAGLTEKDNYRDYLSIAGLLVLDTMQAGNTWLLATSVDDKDRKKQLDLGRKHLTPIESLTMWAPFFSRTNKTDDIA
jgi:hypothetical protein